MASPVVDMELRPKGETAQAPEATGISLFERLARDPSVDVDKLERLMQMHERATARVSEEQFNAAMTAAQIEMRPIAADAYNKQTASKYASYKALDQVLRPIYTKHGFGMSFDTSETPIAEAVRVVCYVTHVGGHKRTYHVDMPADGKGAKGGDVMTRTHATGAAVQYGMRYLSKMIWNVAVGEADDDGNGASVPTKPATKAPAGYEDWLTDVKALADSGAGLPALQSAWQKSKIEYRKHLTSTTPDQWNEIKKVAAKAAAVNA